MKRNSIDSQPEEASAAGHVFDVVRSFQQDQASFVGMVPAYIIAKLFVFDDASLTADLRAQRSIRDDRVSSIMVAILEDFDTLTLAPIIVSVDAHPLFKSTGETGTMVGRLHVPMSARFIVNSSGDHHAAIVKAINADPQLGRQSVPVVFLPDKGLKRCNAILEGIDRNRASRMATDGYCAHADRMPLTRLMIRRVAFLNALTEMNASNLSARSRKLFTLSGLANANAALFTDLKPEGRDQAATIAADWWIAVAKQIPEWQKVHDHKISAGEVRAEFIHTHATVLKAICLIGNAMLCRTQHRVTASMRHRLLGLSKVNWARSNQSWREIISATGRISKRNKTIERAAQLIALSASLPRPRRERSV